MLSTSDARSTLAPARTSLDEEVVVPHVQIAVLGRFDVIVDGARTQASRMSRRHAAALLKLLALAPNHQLHRETVLDTLWPDDTVEDALPKLHKAAYFARRACDSPDAIGMRNDMVHLFPAAELTVDAAEFASLAHRAIERSDIGLARGALARYSGELLPEDRFEPWVEGPREQLAELHRTLLRLTHQWQELLEVDPTDESAHLQLMRGYIAEGDRHAALRQYERLDHALRQELGVAPNHDATRLREQALTEPLPVVSWSRPGSALVGRDREVRLIEGLLDEAELGHAGCVIVVGPAGIGKSALLAAWRERAARDGFRIAGGTAAAIEGAWPYAPVAEAIADLTRINPTLLDDLPQQGRSELERMLTGDDDVSDHDMGHRRFVAIATLLRNAANGSGLLITLDDAHDADDATLRLLHNLARTLRDSPVVLAIAMRPRPLSDVAAEFKHSLISRHGAQEVELAPLKRSDVAQLVAQILPDPDAGLVNQINVLSGGVPGAARELAKRAGTEPHWADRVVLDTIDGIPAATREILQRVATLGTTFDVDDFVDLSRTEPAGAFGHLDAALASGIIEATADGYRFRHNGARKGLLADIPPHRRRLLHREVADRLLRAGKPPARVAHHLLKAGELDRAVPHLLQAAEAHASAGDARGALRLLEAIGERGTTGQRVTLHRLRNRLAEVAREPATPPLKDQGVHPDEPDLLFP
jgi:DNA-binding SARP family transcriptional activator